MPTFVILFIPLWYAVLWIVCVLTHIVLVLASLSISCIGFNRFLLHSVMLVNASSYYQIGFRPVFASNFIALSWDLWILSLMLIGWILCFWLPMTEWWNLSNFYFTKFIVWVWTQRVNCNLFKWGSLTLESSLFFDEQWLNIEIHVNVRFFVTTLSVVICNNITILL